MASADNEQSDCPQRSKNQRLRQLLAGQQIIRSFAPHDVFTARVLEDAGIELLFLGGFGVSASVLGIPDVGLTTLTEMTEAVRRMADRLTVPLIADGDTGHGDLHNVARTVRDFERAGASGMLLEDQVAPKRCGHFAGKQVIPAAEMLDKLKTALDTRADPDFVIIARTDARAVEGFDSAIERANRYGEVGADVCFVEAPQSADELARVARDVPFPQLANMLPGGVTPILPANELQRLGFRIVVDPVGTLLATGHVVRQLAAAMLNDGRVDQLSSQMLGFDEVKQLLGLDEISKLKRS
jgi:2,3-dimethylmalate lyase